MADLPPDDLDMDMFVSAKVTLKADPTPAATGALSAAKPAESEDDLMRRMMGFSGFGGSKAPKKPKQPKQPQAPVGVPQVAAATGGGFRDGAPAAELDILPDVDVVADKAELPSDLPAQFGTSAIDQTLEQLHEPRRVPPSDTTGLYSGGGQCSNVSAIPATHRLQLGPYHERAVSSLAVDPSGSRLLTGSLDTKVLFWGFGGMQTKCRPFKDIDPFYETNIKKETGSYTIAHLAFSTTGDRFLCSASSNYVKLYNKEGAELGVFIKGDMYLSDLTYTKGHIAPVTAIDWVPYDPTVCMTASLDGTVRLWDLERIDKKHRDIIRVGTISRRRRVFSASVSPGGDKIICGTGDGELMVWDYNSANYKRPGLTMASGGAGVSITSCKLSGDNMKAIARCGDETMRVFDLRQPKSALKVFKGLDCLDDNVDCAFGPGYNMAATITSYQRDKYKVTTPGSLVFIDIPKLEIVSQVKMGPGVGPSRMVWSHEIDQVIVGANDNNAYVHYDLANSKKGALLALTVKRKTVEPEMWNLNPKIINPEEEMAKRTTKKQKLTDMFNTKYLRGPKKEMPGWEEKPPETLIGRGHGGRTAVSEYQHLLKLVGMNYNKNRQEDPVEALRKFAQENPEAVSSGIVSGVYKDSQPVTQFAEMEKFDDRDVLGNKMHQNKKQKMMGEIYRAPE
eukprot:gene8160-1457_t